MRPYQLLNSPVGGSVATCNEQWGRPWISQSLADAKDLLEHRCLNLRYSFSTLTVQSPDKAMAASGISTPQNWEFMQWEAMGVIKTAACALRPEALCPCWSFLKGLGTRNFVEDKLYYLISDTALINYGEQHIFNAVPAFSHTRESAVHTIPAPVLDVCSQSTHARGSPVKSVWIWPSV